MKKGFTLFLILVIAVGLWYFILKPNDYIVRFEAPTTVGTVNQSIKYWQLTKKNSSPESSESLDIVKQSFTYGDSTHQYTWKLKPITDSTTAVTLAAKDEDNSLSNRIKVLGGGAFIKKQTETTAKEFYDGLKDHRKKGHCLIVTHGGLLTLLLAHFGRGRTMEDLFALRSPDLFAVEGANWRMLDLPEFT